MAVSQSLTLTQVSQNLEENYSKVRILWQSTQTSGSYNNNRRTAYFYISRNGEPEQEFTVEYTLPSNTTETILDVTITLGHAADGSGAVRVRTWMNTGISAGEQRLSETLTLTQIPRESTVTATDVYIGSATAITVAKKNSAYSHSLYLKFGTEAFYLREDGTASATEVKFTKENLAFTVPERFYKQIPESRSRLCALTVYTYAGNGLIGKSKTSTFLILAREADCLPTVSGTVTDANSETVALTGDSQKLIRYASTAACRIQAQGKCYAQIARQTINGISVTEEITFPQVQTNSFLFSAVDNRGYCASYAVNPEVIPYVPLTCNVTAGRTDPTSGNAAMTIEGNYFEGDFGAEKNTLSVSYRIGDGPAYDAAPTVADGKYRAQVFLEDLDYTQAYTVSITVSDRIRTCNPTVTVGKGIPVFDWGENDFCFHVPVSIQGNTLNGFVMEQGVSNGWTYQKWNDGVLKQWSVQTPTFASWTNWGNEYWKQSNGYSLPFGVPFLDGTRPMVLATNDSATWAVPMVQNVDARGFDLYGIRPYAVSEKAYSYSIFAMGRWK